MEELKSKIESLLFVSAKPMSIKQLSGVLKEKEGKVEEAGDALIQYYNSGKKGIRIVKSASKLQMVSSPENSNLVQLLINDETTGDLSRASLETLTIIAYKGPISKAHLNKIRGVNCSQILRNLLIRGLIESKLNDELNDDCYTITLDFIRFLGISDVSQLPKYDKLHNDEQINSLVQDEMDNSKKELLDSGGGGVKKEEVVEQKKEEFHPEDK